MGIIMKNGVCYSTGSDSDSASLGTGWILYKTQIGSVAVDISEIYDKATEFYVVAKAEGSNSNTLNSLITRNAIENGLERLSLGGDPNIALIEVSNTVFTLTYMKWTSVVTANSVLEIYYKTAEAVVAPVIYSDTEREIGVWRDGKPLYQKTIHISSLPQTSYDTYQIASNIDKVVDYKGIVFYSTGTAVVIFQTRPDNTNSQFYHDIEDDKTFFFRTYRSEQGEAYVTFQYTKTTDTAGSGAWTPSGVPAVHYSTDEQVIGTWVNGKTLYQKTIDCGNLPDSNTKNVPHLISGITPSDIVDISGVGQYAGHYTTPLPKVHDGSINSQVMIEVDDTNIILYSRNGNNASYVGYITLRYTKSTS